MYREPDRRANLVAEQLVALGVADAMVGIFIDRSVETVVGPMAILKAGGRTRPWIPAYPSKRIAATPEETGARVVLMLDGLRGAFDDRCGGGHARRSGPGRGTSRVSRA